MELPKHYDPKSVEPRLYQRWERDGYFHEEPDPARPPFVICMPPPNVTGRAHLGHGSTYTPMDALTRYHRMLGDNADWLPGLDHAAIATEAVIVKEMAKEGMRREDLGRERFVERAWTWSRAYGGEIDKQFRVLGFGPDWQRERFTMDDGLSAAVRKVFVRLYREGLIYRGKRLINWDPKGKTTVSDAEVDHVERDATLWRVRYPFASGDTGAGIEIATTRPETMLGDVAIAVHPQDPRYTHLVGKTVLVPPLLERAIPIIADACVDPEFGTGAVKVTPAHDPTDYDIGLRHGLSMPSIMDFEAKISDAEIGVGPYAGLDRFDARARIVEALRAGGCLVEEQRYRHAISISDRSGDVIEPLLSLQWFVKMESLAGPALQAYRDGALRFTPERHGRVYEQKLAEIRDWNVSRQIWWGHRLPVWYVPDGTPIVAETEEEAYEIAVREHGTRELTRDPDTLDTWFSSALWPFSILGWPQQTLELSCWYPSQVMITGADIIFLWVARMVMLGLHFMQKLPFAEVFITPMVFDAHGNKMSKSLGNAIDPMDLVEKYGADAFRMGLLRQMRLENQEIRFQESRCEEARNFNNKIWNATRYMLALPEGLPGALTLPDRGALTTADRWILTRLHDTIIEISAALDAYDFGRTAESLWRFVWYEFCDWYLEASKAPGSEPTRAAVLSFVWNNAMRLLHPIAPFISEEVWLVLPHDGQTIMTATWPDPLEVPVDREACAAFESLRQTVERIRNVRAESGLAPRERIVVEVPSDLPAEVAALLEQFAAGDLRQKAPAQADVCQALALVEAQAPAELLLHRYAREEQRLEAEVERSLKNLANERFVEKAPPDKVAKEREKLDSYRQELQRVQRARADLESTVTFTGKE
ncbi:MAG TPA: valine--tRNA ligase [Candidatus Baltobacteraceae bacterium]|nr:valine--tRNA ligase [Candidatus Baltobacteraceae bacterium]